MRPPWYEARAGLLDVVVDAGQAFGTGGHATTRQCLEEIQELAPGSLLDLGCGSGVVSLAALRLGFAPVWGVDFDAVAVRAAGENAARNGLAPDLRVADATDPSCALPAADVVVANIALRPILQLAPRFAAGEAGRVAGAPAAPAAGRAARGAGGRGRRGVPGLPRGRASRATASGRSVHLVRAG